MPPARLQRWLDNFAARHGDYSLSVESGAMTGLAADGSAFVAHRPFAETYAGPVDPTAFAQTCVPPPTWGVLLVRKGGFAIARQAGERTEESKVGQRHVQGRTKAGGQSQRRFARRRDNQARVAYEAAAEHAARILSRVRIVVAGGDHTAVDAVLSDDRLARLVVVPPFLAVPDPRRAVLEQAVVDAGSIRLEVTNA